MAHATSLKRAFPWNRSNPAGTESGIGITQGDEVSHRSVRSRHGRANFHARQLRRYGKDTQPVRLRPAEPREKGIFSSRPKNQNSGEEPEAIRSSIYTREDARGDEAENSDIVVSSDSQDESEDSIRIETASSTTSRSRSGGCGKTSGSSESSDTRVGTASTSSEASGAETNAPVFRPRKKNPVLKELRGVAWQSKAKLIDAKKVVQEAGREMAKVAKEAATPDYLQLAKRKHHHPTPEQIKKLKDDFEFEDRKLEKWMGACLPDGVRAKTRAEEVLPFLRLLATGLVLETDGRLSAMKAWLSKQKNPSRVGVQAEIKSYAQGLLDCHAALEKDVEACDTKGNWLPKEFQQAFLESGRSDPENWLWDLVDLQKNSAFKDQFPAFADQYESERKKANIPKDVVGAFTNKEIGHALGYVIAWKVASSKRHLREYVAYGGEMKKLERKKKAVKNTEAED